MLVNCKKFILAVVMSLLASLPVSYAQSLDPISDFKLNSEVNSTEDLDSVTTSSDLFKSEFNLSLGSQMLDYQNSSKVFPSEAEHIDTGFSGLNLNIDFSDKLYKTNDQHDFASVITLNNSYVDNAIGFGDSTVPSLSISGQKGRLSLYGEYNQSNLSIGSGENNTSSRANSSVRASTNNISNTVVNDNLISSTVSSDYYLEAVYSFKPSLKGKVAFKKSVIDTFDLKENVEVEGIVEATSDVSIKAGYSNESHPEVEKKSSKEQKVWTEFILKF